MGCMSLFALLMLKQYAFPVNNLKVCIRQKNVQQAEYAKIAVAVTRVQSLFWLLIKYA